MPEPDAEDSDLLARLRALRQPSPALPATPQRSGSDIEARFRRLGSASPAAAATPERDTKPGEREVPAVSEDIEIQTNVHDVKTLDELLEELGGQQDLDITPDERREAGRLIGKGRKALEDVAREKRAAEGGQAGGERGGSHRKAAEDDQDEQEADEYIARVLAQLEVEKHTGDLDPDGERGDEAEDEHAASEADLSALHLPSAPTDVPTPQRSDNNALGLPSVPSSNPTSTPVKVIKTDLSAPRFTDEEIDSWCVICHDDATIRCLGCDNDLYCTSCWREGHEGEDAGYEERRHKWTRPLPRKRRAVAA